MKIARLVTTLLFCLPIFAQDATMFRGNLTHTGVYNAAGLPKFNKIKWKFHTEGQAISSPTVAGATVYVGSTDGNLYAVEWNPARRNGSFPPESASRHLRR